MNSPYTSALLDDPKTNVSPPPAWPQAMAPAPAAPQWVMVQSPKSGSSAFNSLLLFLVTVLAAVVAAAAGFLVADQMAPSAAEYNTSQQIAAREGFMNGRVRGYQAGRTWGLAAREPISAYQAALARQKAWNAGYRQGNKTGRASYRRPSYNYGYSGYYGRGRSWYSPRRSNWGGAATAWRDSYAVSSAVNSAQQIANATGAPVDVEVY